MFVMAEVICGKTYLLDEHGRVWRISSDYDFQPLIELLDNVPPDRIEKFLAPKLTRWSQDAP